MQCERLLRLTKSWYIKVKDETMAPARMISFMEKHVADCEICLADPDLKGELARIQEIVLPESKVPKAVRMQQEKDALKEDLEDEELEESEGDEDEELDDEDDIDDEFDDDEFVEDDDI